MAESDFVFEKDHKLPTLQEVEKQIREKGHLKNIPDEKRNFGEWHRFRRNEH